MGVGGGLYPGGLISGIIHSLADGWALKPGGVIVGFLVSEIFRAIRPDQFNFREHGFFSNFEGSVGRKKKENKKKSPIFCIGFDYQ